MDRRPHFLFLFPDQWRGDCLGSLGHPVVETPFPDQLAAEGTTFTSAYTPCPSCIAARASLITGMTPSSAGRMGYRDGVPWTYANTLMRLLRDGGYQTMMVGKTHFHPPRARLGFEELALYEAPVYPGGASSDYHSWLRREAGDAIRDTAEELDTNSYLAHPWTHPEHLHPNAWTVTAAVDLLDRRDPTRPFFLQVGFHRPHPPFDPPLSFFERYQDRPLPPVPMGDWAREHDRPATKIDTSRGRLPEHVLARSRRAYYAQLSYLDFQIGRLLRYLKREELLADTFIVFSSDHGELLGDHCMFRKSNPWEGSAHIPLLVKAPPAAGCPQGARRSEPVTLTDLMPTFLESAGVPAPDTVEARSILPLVRGEGVPWRDYVHGEHAPGDGAWQFVTDGREKFIWESRSGREWLFDLARDPQETTDLAGEPGHAGRVALWRERLVRVLAERPQDGLTDGRRLIPGKAAPCVR